MDQITYSSPLDVLTSMPDRCDRCGAAAKLRMTLTDGDLAFCGHHANRNAAMIAQNAVRVAVLSEFLWVGAAAPGTPASTPEGWTDADRAPRP